MVEKKPVLLLDQDETICDLYKLLVPRLNKTYGLTLDEQDYNKYFGDHTILQCGLDAGIDRIKIDTIFKTGHFFFDIPPIPGAVEAIKKLRDYYDIYIVTTPYLGANDPFKDKHNWVLKYLKFLKENMILTSHKELICGDILVDDRPPNCKSWKDAHPSGHTASLKYHWTDEKMIDIVEPTWALLGERLIKLTGG